MEKYKCNFCVSFCCVRMYQINTHLIGMNAGKVWEALQENQSLTQHQIMNETGLNGEKFNQAVGWLSRENKIRKDGEFYSLSETNLTDSIGSNAGVVVTVLEDLAESVEGLEHLTRIQPDEFQQAVGWLAREGHFKQPENRSVQTEAHSMAEQVKRLQNEIEAVSDEVVSRNHIINELTRQLTASQTESIQDTDVIEKLNVQLAKSHQHISAVDERNAESVQKIRFLENEIRGLHGELSSRNHIINELSRQLTSTQTTIIAQSDRIERLQNAVGKKPDVSGSVSNSLRHRLHRITQLQKSLETTQETPLMSETKLYNPEGNTPTQSPVLDISQSQSVSDEELREALQELHQDIDDKISQKKPQLHPEDSC